MSRAALVHTPTGLIRNVIEVEPGSDYEPPEHHELVDDPNGQAEVGGSWNGTSFAPAPPYVPTPEEANRRTLEDRADAALISNATYLAIATPNNAQIAAQVKDLTRQSSALIRLVLNRLDSIN